MTSTYDIVHTPHPLSGQKISQESYELIWNLPKVLLHEHFSGRSDLYEMARIAQMYIDQGLGEALEWIHPETGILESVSLNYLRENLKARAYFLCPEHLARLYRVINPPERHAIFVERTHLNEDGSLLISEEDLEKKVESLRIQGLSSYRATSQRINLLVKNEAFVYSLASAFARQLALENVFYAECRVSPLSYQCQSIETLIDRISEGLKLGRAEAANNLKFIDTGILLVIERHSKEPLKDSLLIANEAIRLRKLGYPIVGIDVAGDEWNYPVTLFREAFDLIKNHNEDSSTHEEERLGITVHAGEVLKSGHLTALESIECAIDLATSPQTPVRIGHGIQIIHSHPLLDEAFAEFRRRPEGWQERYSCSELIEKIPLLKKVMDRKIVFEMCPKSNVQTFAVPYHESHPAVFLSRLGLKVTLSSDNRLISKSNASNEFVKLYKYAHANYADMKRMVLSGLEGAFIMNAGAKRNLLQRAVLAFEDLEEHTRLLKNTKEIFQ